MVKAEISSSETDTSAGEELNKSREMAIKGLSSDPRGSMVKRKHRSWSSRRFWRTHNSNSSTQGSASDHETPDNPALIDNISSADSASRKGNRHLRLPSRTASSGRQASSTESLLSIIRNFSTSNHRTPSTPSSPKSDYEISSSFPTPLSTPGSPAGSLEAISQSSNVSDVTTIQVKIF